MRSDLGSIREIGSGVWLVQVSLGYDRLTGKRRRPSRTVRGTRRDAERMLVRMLTEHGLMEPQGLTLTDFFETIYMPRLREKVTAGQIRRSTVDDYEQKWERHIKPHLGSLKITRIQPYQLEQWLTTLAMTKRVKRAGVISGRTQLRVFRVLSTAFNKAVAWRVIQANPLTGMEPPKAEEYRPDVLNVVGANEYLDLFIDTELEAIVAIAIAGGLRRSELAALDWTADVDFDAGGVWVLRGRHQRKGEIYFEPPKSRNSKRFVALSPWAMEILTRRRGIGPVCGTLTPSQISARYKAVVTKSALPWVTLKNLRHSSATIALSLGVDLVAVSRRLGHATSAVTDTFYVKPGLEADTRAAAAMEGLRTKKRARRHA